jgi:hypothetical protein
MKGASGQAWATAGHIWAITDAQVDHMHAFGTAAAQLRVRSDMPAAQTSPGLSLSGPSHQVGPLMPGVTSRPPASVVLDGPSLNVVDNQPTALCQAAADGWGPLRGSLAW